MATTALTPLQTQVLGLLTNSKAAGTNPHHVLAACRVMLYLRAGCSDEDTMFYLDKMVERSLLRADELPQELRH